MYGLLDRDIKYIKEAASKYPELERLIIFGSRALGNYKSSSDVDMALVGKEVTDKSLKSLSDDLNENYPLPYFFDLVNYNEISNTELKEHIDKMGKLFYMRKEDYSEES